MGGLIPTATIEKDGLMSAIYRRRIVHIGLPGISTTAKQIASYRKISGYAGHTLNIVVGSFRASCNFILYCDQAANNADFYVKGFGVAERDFKILIIDDGEEYKIYITGTYPSVYDKPSALVESTSD